jgi:hypothetical protein
MCLSWDGFSAIDLEIDAGGWLIAAMGWNWPVRELAVGRFAGLG